MLAIFILSTPIVLHFARPSGNTAWSKTSQKLAIWNLMDGIDIYNVSDRLSRVGKLRIPIKHNFPVQVAFGAQDSTVVSGSDSGEIYIWDLKSEKPLQILIHSPGENFD